MHTKHLRQMMAGMAVLVFGGAFAATPVFAAPQFNPGVAVFDDFSQSNTIYQPQQGAYWWIDGQGTLPDGTAARVRGTNNCSLQTCISIVSDSASQFLRLDGFPTTTIANYTNANWTEQPDGADTDPTLNSHLWPGIWNPTPGHPVEVETRMRFGPNFNKDGTGGAKGTTGVWLWNNPFSIQATDPFSVYDGIGFSWASTDSEVAQGLTMTVVKAAKPVFVQPVLANININDWNTYKFVWSQDIAGVQQVTFYINGVLQATAPMVPGVSTEQNLGLEVWLDNQAFKATTFPNFLNRVLIDQERHVDYGYMSIKKD